MPTRPGLSDNVISKQGDVVKMMAEDPAIAAYSPNKNVLAGIDHFMTVEWLLETHKRYLN